MLDHLPNNAPFETADRPREPQRAKNLCFDARPGTLPDAAKEFREGDQIRLFSFAPSDWLSASIAGRNSDGSFAVTLVQYVGGEPRPLGTCDAAVDGQGMVFGKFADGSFSAGRDLVSDAFGNPLDSYRASAWGVDFASEESFASGSAATRCDHGPMRAVDGARATFARGSEFRLYGFAPGNWLHGNVMEDLGDGKFKITANQAVAGEIRNGPIELVGTFTQRGFEMLPPYAKDVFNNEFRSYDAESFWVRNVSMDSNKPETPATAALVETAKPSAPAISPACPLLAEGCAEKVLAALEPGERQNERVEQAIAEMNAAASSFTGVAASIARVLQETMARDADRMVADARRDDAIARLAAAVESLSKGQPAEPLTRTFEPGTGTVRKSDEAKQLDLTGKYAGVIPPADDGKPLEPKPSDASAAMLVAGSSSSRTTVVQTVTTTGGAENPADAATESVDLTALSMVVGALVKSKGGKIHWGGKDLVLMRLQQNAFSLRTVQSEGPAKPELPADRSANSLPYGKDGLAAPETPLPEPVRSYTVKGQKNDAGKIAELLYGIWTENGTSNVQRSLDLLALSASVGTFNQKPTPMEAKLRKLDEDLARKGELGWVEHKHRRIRKIGSHYEVHTRPLKVAESEKILLTLEKDVRGSASGQVQRHNFEIRGNRKGWEIHMDGFWEKASKHEILTILTEAKWETMTRDEMGHYLHPRKKPGKKKKSSGRKGRKTLESAQGTTLVPPTISVRNPQLAGAAAPLQTTVTTVTTVTEEREKSVVAIAATGDEAVKTVVSAVSSIVPAAIATEAKNVEILAVDNPTAVPETGQGDDRNGVPPTE